MGTPKGFNIKETVTSSKKCYCTEKAFNERAWYGIVKRVEHFEDRHSDGIVRGDKP